MKRIEKIAVLICLLAITHMSVSAQGYELPKYSKFKLSNGLTVYLMEQHDVPVISVSAILSAGAINDGDQSGLATLTAAALKHGTKNYTKATIDEELDFVGAYVNVSASKEFTRLSSKFATKDEEKVMDIIKDILRNPVFDAEEFKKEKKRFLVGLDRQKESPSSVIQPYFDQFIYGKHVYGNVSSGTKSTVEKLTVEDVKNFYQKNYTPNNAAISIVGDFDSKEMKKTLKSLFSGWEKGSTSKNLASKTISKPSENKVLLVNKDDSKETRFYIGSLGVSRNNKDIVSIQVINTLFGGRFTSMLNSELRINLGLTYGARSGFASYKNSGTFSIRTYTATETTEKTIDKALEILGNLHKGLDEKSLTSAKNYVKGQFPPRYETTNQLSNLLTEMFWYDFDESFINNFEKNVDGLNLSEANKIIGKYFPKDNLQFVLIGKASEIKKIAEKYGPVKQVEIKDGL